jgi:CspA family cold shock protein
MAALNGTIKRLVTEKGFGFIATSDGTEYFFHSSACTQTPFGQLREGQAVTFERGQGPKDRAVRTCGLPERCALSATPQTVGET